MEEASPDGEIRNIELGDFERQLSTSKKVSFLKGPSPKSVLSSGASNVAKSNVNPNDVKKFECKNIVQACFYLEHKEKYDNIPRFRDLDKEQVLGDLRLQKLNEMFNLLKEFDDASDPQTLKKMFIYYNNVQ